MKRLYFIYPSLHIDHDELGKIISEAQFKFDVPFHHIKVIGSKHQGFSFMDKNENGTIKYVHEKSDIDLAIIDSSLFNKLATNTMIETRNFTDKTKFKSNNPSSKHTFDYFSYYRKNLISGFIRPDSLGRYEDRKLFEDFSRDMLEEYNTKISAAVYLNEMCFIERLNKQIHQFYEMREVKDGLK